MKKTGASFLLSATDLVGHLNCQHLTTLDRLVADGALPKPKVWDPLLEILSERGTRHEQAYIEHLESTGLRVARIEGTEVTDAAVRETLDAMRRGSPVIVQAALSSNGWIGRADAALSSVGGVYLVSDGETGDLYVGSASGAGGIWQRWTDYSATGHGGNVELRAVVNGSGLDRAKPFRFSILEIADIHTGEADVIARECHWKRVLLSRSHGLNGN